MLRSSLRHHNHHHHTCRRKELYLDGSSTYAMVASPSIATAASIEKLLVHATIEEACPSIDLLELLVAESASSASIADECCCC